MAHENLHRQQHVEGSSDRGFGLVFAAVFAIIAATRPAVLARANRLWARFGVALGNIAGPLAVGVLFYAIVTPLGWLMRLTPSTTAPRRSGGQ